MTLCSKCTHHPSPLGRLLSFRRTKSSKLSLLPAGLAAGLLPAAALALRLGLGSAANPPRSLRQLGSSGFLRLEACRRTLLAPLQRLVRVGSRPLRCTFGRLLLCRAPGIQFCHRGELNPALTARYPSPNPCRSNRHSGRHRRRHLVCSHKQMMGRWSNQPRAFEARPFERSLIDGIYFSILDSFPARHGVSCRYGVALRSGAWLCATSSQPASKLTC